MAGTTTTKSSYRLPSNQSSWSLEVILNDSLTLSLSVDSQIFFLHGFSLLVTVRQSLATHSRLS